jgi:hypothetical protein
MNSIIAELIKELEKQKLSVDSFEVKYSKNNSKFKINLIIFWATFAEDLRNKIYKKFNLDDCIQEKIIVCFMRDKNNFYLDIRFSESMIYDISECLCIPADEAAGIAYNICMELKSSLKNLERMINNEPL